MTETEGKTLCLMPTFRCTAECENCGTFSSPRESTRLSLKKMLSVIEQATSEDYREVIFTGGEPTLAGDDLLKAMRYAALSGLHVKMVTNGHWAANASAAAKCVKDFVSNGLAEVNLSTGNRHTAYVPTESIIHAGRAAVAAGLTVAILIETTGKDSINREAIESRADFKAILQDHPYAPLEIVDWTWMPVSPFKLESYPKDLTVNKNNLEQCGGCHDIQKITTVQADGSISPCCGLGIRFVPELKLGNINEVTLSEVNQLTENNPLLQRIKSEGPEHVLARAAEFDDRIKWENMYAHRCQACIRVFKDSRVRKVIS